MYRVLDILESRADHPLDAMNDAPPPEIESRQRWLSLLAHSEESRLEEHWQSLRERPRYEYLRGPEVGMVMLQGRISGTGSPFNLGEMPVTRCAVRVGDGAIGVGYVAGRRPRHSELVAIFDCLLQDGEWHPILETSLLSPLAEARSTALREKAQAAARTRVEFFTMVRGES